jgi:hypothetical protein
MAGQSNVTGYLSDATDVSSGADFFAAPYANGADEQSTIAWCQSFVVPPRTRRPVPLATPQVRGGSAKVQIFGPEIGLARTLFADAGRAVTIVKVAFGGQPIAAWNPSVPDGLFDRLASLVAATLAHDAESGWLDAVGALFWYHGEADARSASLAEQYRAGLVALIEGFRAGLPLGPATPIVLVKQSTPDRPGDAAVRAADDWAGTHLPHVVVVDSVDLPRMDDGLHLTNRAELELGRRMATVIEPGLR